MNLQPRSQNLCLRHRHIGNVQYGIFVIFLFHAFHDIFDLDLWPCDSKCIQTTVPPYAYMSQVWSWIFKVIAGTNYFYAHYDLSDLWTLTLRPQNPIRELSLPYAYMSQVCMYADLAYNVHVHVDLAHGSSVCTVLPEAPALTVAVVISAHCITTCKCAMSYMYLDGCYAPSHVMKKVSTISRIQKAEA